MKKVFLIVACALLASCKTSNFTGGGGLTGITQTPEGIVLDFNFYGTGNIPEKMDSALRGLPVSLGILSIEAHADSTNAFHGKGKILIPPLK